MERIIYKGFAGVMAQWLTLRTSRSMVQIPTEKTLVTSLIEVHPKAHMNLCVKLKRMKNRTK